MRDYTKLEFRKQEKGRRMGLWREETVGGAE